MSTKLSLRTFICFSAASATTFGIFLPSHDALATFAASIELIGLLALLMITCATFASVADDLWRDPEFTFAAALFGFLGFSVILFLGMLAPVIAR